jgi:SAM-dependent methyltransferase
MTQAFDAYRDSYEATVEQSIGFSGLSHDFFLEAKAALLAALFAAHFGPGYRPSLLDIGCGVGRMHPLLAPLAGALAGTDPSAAEIDRARQDNPDVDYRVGDGLRLPWSAASFEVALAVCVVHHVPAPAWSDFVAEMRRVVRPGGLVVLIEHNPWNPLTRLSVLRCAFDRDAVLLPAGRACALLAGAGCAAVESRHFLLLPTGHPVARRVEGALRRLPLGAQYAAIGRV